MDAKRKMTMLMLITALAVGDLAGPGLGVYAAESAVSRIAGAGLDQVDGYAQMNGASAYDGVCYESVDPAENEAIAIYEAQETNGTDALAPYAASKVETAYGVTEDMCVSSYWDDRNAGSGIGIGDRLITIEEINSLNQELLNTKDANMYDLENMASTYNAKTLLSSLVSGTVPVKDKLFVDDVQTDPKTYYDSVAAEIDATGYKDESRENDYSVAVRRTPVCSIPVHSYIGYSKGDTDDEKTSAALLVNEPFVIRQKATVSGNVFYWGYSDNCTGWVAEEDLAVCSNKDEWLDAWKTDPEKDDFIVVTQNQITLEPSLTKPELSQVKLTFSTILKSVPEDQYPVSIGERGPWNNHVVYLPLRDNDGKYVKGIALISQHYEVSRGFLAMTQKEILRVAFNNLGDRYGWGGMLDSMDCSMFTRNVYRCFGLILPRNTNWQQALPGRKINLSGKSDEYKVQALRRMPAGTLLYISGHTMIYVGTDRLDGKEMAYVISDTESLSDSTGDVKVRTMYSVILNPLTARRRNGTTWLVNVTAAVLPISSENMDFVSKNVAEMTPIMPAPSKRVPAAEGQTYASSQDSLPLETFLSNTGNMYISFCNVPGSGIERLSATVIKGSKVTTKAPVKSVTCDKGLASIKINKNNGLATVTLNKTGKVSFEMKDGNKYDVYFTVETPKAQTSAVKASVKGAKEKGLSSLTLSVNGLFGTGIDGGVLEVASQRSGSASVAGNQLTLKLSNKDTVKMNYMYLNKKYSIKISVP